MLIAIDEILGLLRNGEWHGVKELADKSRFQESKVELITSFLAKYDFLEFDQKEKRVKLSQQLRLFLSKIEDLDRDASRRRLNLL
jgi:DNA-binding IclR family transcriptional regulator